MGTSRNTAQNIVICGECNRTAGFVQDGESEEWLFKEEPADLSMKEFLEWHDENYGQMKVEGAPDIPWKELVSLVSVVLMVLGRGDLAPESVARDMLPYIREPDGRAREREPGKEA